MEVKKVNSGQLASGTAEERAHQRHRRAAWASVTSVGSKLASVITILVTAPLTIRYLGMERYGMWMTIASGGRHALLVRPRHRQRPDDAHRRDPWPQ